MGWIPGVPIDDGANVHGTRRSRPMVTGHRTYGFWPGDYSVIKNGGLAHLLIGKDEGQWVQFAPTEGLMYHCNGSNDGYGIEITGRNEEPFTDWQIRCLRYIVPKLGEMIDVPLAYSDGLDGWVSGHTYVGFHAHNGILTDDGSSQHTNLWMRSDWDQIVAPAPAPVVITDGGEMDMYVGQLEHPASIGNIPVPAGQRIALLTSPSGRIVSSWAGDGPFGIPQNAVDWLGAGGRAKVNVIVLDAAQLVGVIEADAATRAQVDIHALAQALAPLVSGQGGAGPLNVVLSGTASPA